MSTTGVPSGLTRLIRRCALVRSPLVRTTDRVEGVVTALVMLLAFVMIGLGGAVGLGEYPAQLARAEALAQERSEQGAVLVEDAVNATEMNGAQTLPMGATARVRWISPDGREHTGRADVTEGQRAGSETQIWVDGTGEITPPPPSTADAAVAAVMAGIGAVLLGWLILGAVWWGVHRTVAWRNLARWDVEWAQTSSRWSPWLD